MQYDSVKTIINRLNAAGVRYLVVGGLAVAAHGYLRFTADLDLMIGFDTANVGAAIDVFRSLSYQPRAPVPIEDFAVQARRELWARTKNMIVFSLFSHRYPGTEIDLFIEEPLDFETADRNAIRMPITEGVIAPICSLSDLIKLKKIAGRPQDLLDIEKLRLIHGETQ